MAEKKPEGGEGEVPAAPKKKTKLFIIIGVAVLLLVLIGAGVAVMLSKKKASEEDTGDEPTKEEKATKKKDHDTPPVYVKLDQFTVQLQPENRDAFLQATINLRMLDAAAGESIKQYGPSVRNRVLMILVSKKPSEVSTAQGMQSLAYEIRDAINAIVGEPRRKKAGAAAAGPAEKAGPDDPVQEILFESFIIQ